MLTDTTQVRAYGKSGFCGFIRLLGDLIVSSYHIISLSRTNTIYRQVVFLFFSYNLVFYILVIFLTINKNSTHLCYDQLPENLILLLLLSGVSLVSLLVVSLCISRYVSLAIQTYMFLLKYNRIIIRYLYLYYQEN